MYVFAALSSGCDNVTKSPEGFVMSIGADARDKPLRWVCHMRVHLESHVRLERSERSPPSQPWLRRWRFLASARNDAGQSGELPPCEQQGGGGYQNRANNREGPSSGPAGGGKLDARIIPDADLSGLLILASHPVIVAFVIHD